jgi:hypothetical protein
MSLKLKGLIVGARITPENELMGFYMFSNTVTVHAKLHTLGTLIGVGTALSGATSVSFTGNSTGYTASTVNRAVGSGGTTATGSFSASFSPTATLTLLTISAYASSASPYLTATVSVVLNASDTFGIQWTVTAT